MVELDTEMDDANNVSVYADCGGALKVLTVTTGPVVITSDLAQLSA